MFWIACSSVELLSLWRFFSWCAMQSESPRLRLVIICLCYLICYNQKEFDWRQAGGLSVDHSCGKDEQLQCLWNRAESNHYFCCIQQISSGILKYCLACQLLLTELCLPRLRQEPVGNIMQRSWARKGLISSTYISANTSHVSLGKCF